MMRHNYWVTVVIFVLTITGFYGCGSQGVVTKKSDTSGPLSNVRAEERNNYNVYAVAFYNLENLFDTVDDPENSGDDEFLPTGPYHWTETKYRAKLHNLAKVLSRLGRQYSPSGPAAIAVSELENKKVLEDLLQEPELKAMGLRILHHSSPDRRGIDVALLYNPKLFRLDSYKAFKYRPPYGHDGYVSRDELLVTGTMAGETVHLLINHWPSKYGGDKSSVFREASASLSKDIIDSLYRVDPSTKLILLGDLNDNPDEKSVFEVLGAKLYKTQVEKNGLYNATAEPYNKGVGSLAYQDKWNLYDQQIITEPFLVDKESGQLSYWKVEVFNPPFLITKEGKRKGYPLRTFESNTFINGYSDHFPTITYFLKKK